MHSGIIYQFEYKKKICTAVKASKDVHADHKPVRAPLPLYISQCHTAFIKAAHFSHACNQKSRVHITLKHTSKRNAIFHIRESENTMTKSRIKKEKKTEQKNSAYKTQQQLNAQQQGFYSLFKHSSCLRIIGHFRYFWTLLSRRSGEQDCTDCGS